MNNENKAEILMGSLFCTFELIEKSIYYGSDYPKSSFKQVWVILQVYSISVGWYKLNPRINYPWKKWYAMGTSSFPQL